MKSFKSFSVSSAPRGAHRGAGLLAVAVGVVVVGQAAPAHAYLDPGTGTMIVQLIMGGVAGAMVVGKLYWQRVKSVFGFSNAETFDSEGDDRAAGGSKAAETDAD